MKTPNFQILKNEYLNGLTLQELGDKYDVDKSTIRWKLSYYGFIDFRKKLTERQRKIKSLQCTGRKHTKESKEKMRQHKLGVNNPQWKGGITPERVKIWKSKEYRNWRNEVFKRDNYICKFCGQKGCRTHPIEAHHIYKFSEYIELRFDINNGITLCKDCHLKTKTKEYLYINKCKKILEVK